MELSGQINKSGGGFDRSAISINSGG